MSIPDRIDEYFAHVRRQLDTVLAGQHEVMHEVADTWATAIAADRMLYVFGSGHSRLIAGELSWRAGGLAPVVVLDDPSEGAAERLEGYASAITGAYDFGEGDVLIVISNSGINAVPIEVALEGTARGATVVAITALEHSQRSASRHSSGRRLFEIADHVLDTCGPYGDAAVAITGRDWRAGATSTVVSVAILDGMVAQTAELLAQRGLEPPVLVSANVPEGDTQNERLGRHYWRRLTRFPRRTV
jgi:uncharacterized phosphosugar-binding protein